VSAFTHKCIGTEGLCRWSETGVVQIYGHQLWKM